MNTLVEKIKMAVKDLKYETDYEHFVVGVRFSKTHFTVSIHDGRSLKVPVNWFPRLYHGTEKERNAYRLIGQGEGIAWDSLDEHIGLETLLAGQKSGETPQSIKRWLKQRKNHKTRDGISHKRHKRHKR